MGDVPTINRKRVLHRQTCLRAELAIMEAYLSMRVQMRDWHGVRDAAADIEQMEAKLAVIEEILR